jgi:tRNA threonylcarbamoyladenosine biosynthesis protein TsaB
LDAAAFCDGPGSVLGVRLAAATLRSWRAAHPALALYSFHSLPLLAVVESKNNGATIIADARRDTWHAVRPDSPHMLLRLATAELATLGALATPDNFRRWSALPEGVHPSCVAYSAASLLTSSPDEPFFAPASEPDAFMHEPPSYVAWTPHIHQAQSTRAAG